MTLNSTSTCVAVLQLCRPWSFLSHGQAFASFIWRPYPEQQQACIIPFPAFLILCKITSFLFEAWRWHCWGCFQICIALVLSYPSLQNIFISPLFDPPASSRVHQYTVSREIEETCKDESGELLDRHRQNKGSLASISPCTVRPLLL